MGRNEITGELMVTSWLAQKIATSASSIVRFTTMVNGPPCPRNVVVAARRRALLGSRRHDQGIQDQISTRTTRMILRVKACQTRISSPSILAYPLIAGRSEPPGLLRDALTRTVCPCCLLCAAGAISVTVPAISPSCQTTVAAVLCRPP